VAGLLLNEQERELLEKYSNTVSGIQQRRAHLILLYDDGLLTHQAAEQAGFSRSQARFWKHQFLLEGLLIFPELVDRNPVKEASSVTLDLPQEADGKAESQKPADNFTVVELSFPEPVKRPGILASDSLAEAGRKTWFYLFAEMLQKENPTRSGENIEDLHDMRVATRRMRSAFDVFEEAFKPKTIKRHLKGLRAVGHALGRVRDMDVLIEKLDYYISALEDTRREGLDPLMSAWRQERENGRQELITLFDSQEYSQFKQEFNQFVQTPGDGVLERSQTTPQAHLVCEIVPALIYTRMGTVRAYDTILNIASDTQLHALRIEFKKLRYAVEYFREVLGAEAGQVISDLKLLQDHLGDFHDTVVACDLLTKFLRDWEGTQLTKPLIARQNPEHIVTYLAHLYAERHRLLVTLPEAWDHFNRPGFRSNLAKAIAAL